MFSAFYEFRLKIPRFIIKFPNFSKFSVTMVLNIQYEIICIKNVAKIHFLSARHISLIKKAKKNKQFT